jgi:pyruvate/2-oxoglutarate dehydrogenase complex dihydrolipoamide dehydrogenase (E3) component
MTTRKVDIAIIGGGSGGLSVAAGAAQMGARVLLAEGRRMGGDCLNWGCVPSKALIAAGAAANAVRTSGRFGVNGHEPDIDFKAVHDHVHGVIAGIAPHDSVERFEKLGVEVVQAHAKFISPREIEVGGHRVRARRFVIATGSRPSAPPIAGLDKTPYLTNETIFDLVERPGHLIVVGGGPIGLELAAAHRRLGASVTVLEAAAILANDDVDAVTVVRDRLQAEGVDIREGVTIEAVEADGNGIAVDTFQSGERSRISGTHLLVATGRRPNIMGLGLDAAGIRKDGRGIVVDARLRTTNKRVFVIGDAAGGLQFTHVAAYHAGIVIRNAIFNLPAKASTRAIPRVTYTDPELAHVGVRIGEAQKDDPKAQAVVWSFAENDRARTERETEGLVKAVIGRKGEVLGCTIVGSHAGELILPWVLAVEKRLKVSDMASVVAPYPTLSEVTKRAAGSYYTPKLFSAKTRRIVRLMQQLP